jgi:Cys-tRNA synthase (O-phospho-L-seryl-tRNA:Cys-tRNA synthase)
LEAKNFRDSQGKSESKARLKIKQPQLEEKGIWGPQPGLAMSFKLSTFAADKEQLGVVIDSFKAILNKYT